MEQEGGGKELLERAQVGWVEEEGSGEEISVHLVVYFPLVVVLGVSKGWTGILQQDDIVIYIIYSYEEGFSRMSLFWVVLAQLAGVSKALTTELVH